ncbi:MAG TPA: YceI family protein, partial [Paraburkholderia sp.]|nr:YceI family protein [Paraburkholderia sp.]
MIQRLASKVSVVALGAALAAGAAFTASFAMNADAAAEAAKSSVSAVFKQMNVPVEGRFNHFNADVRFDPANAAASSAKLDVDVASFDLGSPDYNKEV